MFLSETIEDFAGYARAELGHTPATVWTYRSRQRHFARWLVASGLPDLPAGEITAQLIRRYTYSLTAQNLRPSSIRGALNAIRALFTNLCHMGALSENPALEVRLPRKDAAHRLLVSDEELGKLLAAAEWQRTEFRCVRDTAVLCSENSQGLATEPPIQSSSPHLCWLLESLGPPQLLHGSAQQFRPRFPNLLSPL